MEPPRKRHKQNAESLSHKTTSNDIPTKDQLLKCITSHADQYLCKDLGPLITEYTYSCFEILTRHSVMCFNDTSCTWTISEFNPKLRFFCEIAKLNGKVYALGSPDVLCYSEFNKWTTIARMNIRRFNYKVGVLNDKLYVIGGYAGIKAVSNMECYDEISNQWTQMASMNTRREFFNLGVLKGKLYAVGGYNGETDPQYLNNVECYDDASNQWITVAPMNTARNDHGVGVLNGKLYVMGGVKGNEALSSVECYDDVKNQWTVMQPMTTPRYNAHVGVMYGKLYIAGGFNLNFGQLHTVECYDDVSNKWALVPTMNLLTAFVNKL